MAWSSGFIYLLSVNLPWLITSLGMEGKEGVGIGIGGDVDEWTIVISAADGSGMLGIGAPEFIMLVVRGTFNRDFVCIVSGQ